MDELKDHKDEIFYLMAFLEKKERRSVACTSKEWYEKVRRNTQWVGKCNCASALVNKWLVKPYLTSITLHGTIYQYHNAFDQCFTQKLRHISIYCPEEDIGAISQLLFKAAHVKSIELTNTMDVRGLLELVSPCLEKLRLVIVVNISDKREEKIMYVRSSSKASFKRYKKGCAKRR